MSASSFRPHLNSTLSLCPIPKVGYKTWWDIFVAIWKKVPQTNRRGKEVRWVRGSTATQGQGHAEIKFVFVREPYSRLLSAYVDKLFVPDSYFDKLGTYIVRAFRANASSESLKFGHDVTFAELVKYVIHAESTGRKRDYHFVPAHAQCNMCEVCQ